MPEDFDAVVDAVLEREAYRSVLSAALTLLYERHVEIQVLSNQLQQVRAEYREFRAAIMRRDEGET